MSGYTGGTLDDPTYRQVTRGGSGHLEAVQVTYDPSKVTYAALVDYFFVHIDPTDAAGQFCDKGDSYRTAVFVDGAEEKGIATSKVAEIEDSEQLRDPVVTRILDEAEFFEAEAYHQDYYLKNPVKYNYYRTACGRDRRLRQLWGDESS